MLKPIIRLEGQDENFGYVATQPQLEQMVSELFKQPNSMITNYKPDDSWWLDVYYRAMPIYLFGEFLQNWRSFLNLVVYFPELFDCDDFAWVFSAFSRIARYPFGVVVGKLYYNGEFLGYHAWNLLLFCNPNWSDPLTSFRVFEFEPQTGEIIMNHKSTDGFTYEGEWVIW